MTASKTSLVDKLGIKPEYCITIINPPENFEERLGDLPDSVRVENFLEEVDFDLIQFFTQEKADLEQQFEYLMNCLNGKGALWITWPQEASKLKSDLSEGDVKEVGEKAGLVVKTVCDLDEDWCAVKFEHSTK